MKLPFHLSVLTIVTLTPFLLETRADDLKKLEIKEYFPTRIETIPKTTDLLVTGAATADIGNLHKYNDKYADAMFAKIYTSGEKIEQRWMKMIGREKDQITYKILIDKKKDEYYVIGSSTAAFDDQKEWKDSAPYLFLTKFSSSGDKKWTRFFGVASSELMDAVFDQKSSSVFIVTLSNLYSNVLIIYNSDGIESLKTTFPVGSMVRALYYDEKHDKILGAGYSLVSLADKSPKDGGQGFLAQLTSDGKFEKVFFIDSNFAVTSIVCNADCDVIYAGGAEFVTSQKDNIEDIDCVVYALTFDEIKWSKKWGSKAADAVFQVVYSKKYDIIIVSGASMGSSGDHKNEGQEDAFIKTYDPKGNSKYTRYFGTEDIDIISSVSVNEDDGALYVLLHHLYDYETATAAFMVIIQGYELKEVHKEPLIDSKKSKEEPKQISNGSSSGSSGSSGLGTFFLVVFFLSAFGTIGFFVYKKYGDKIKIKRYIRLPIDEELMMSPGSTASS